MLEKQRNPAARFPFNATRSPLTKREARSEEREAGRGVLLPLPLGLLVVMDVMIPSGVER